MSMNKCNIVMMAVLLVSCPYQQLAESRLML